MQHVSQFGPFVFWQITDSKNTAKVNFFKANRKPTEKLSIINAGGCKTRLNKFRYLV